MKLQIENFFFAQILLILSSSCLGTVPHTQMTSNTIVTMTMASHSSHATAVTTSAIPVGKFVILCLCLEHRCVLQKQEVLVVVVCFSKSFS